jgi:hypothetical protein
VRGRVCTVDAAAEDCDRVTIGLEGTAMRLAVDTARHSADDDQARRRELATEHARDLSAVRRTRTRADDGDGRAREQFRLPLTAKIETPRRTVSRGEQRRQITASKHPHCFSSGGAR